MFHMNVDMIGFKDYLLRMERTKNFGFAVWGVAAVVIGLGLFLEGYPYPVRGVCAYICCAWRRSSLRNHASRGGFGENFAIACTLARDFIHSPTFRYLHIKFYIAV
jgi:hypothetical protein